MSNERDLPTDDTLMPPAGKTGGIPLGMQAGAKAGADLTERSDELQVAAVGDSRGAVTRVAGSDADAIGGSSIGDSGDPLPPEAGGNAYDEDPFDPRPGRPVRENG